MIIVTGGAGFIGSALIAALNKKQITDILVVDELGTDHKWKNLRNLSFADRQPRCRSRPQAGLTDYYKHAVFRAIYPAPICSGVR